MLGNVSGLPTGAESAFAAVEDEVDGSVWVTLAPQVKGSAPVTDYASDLKVQYAAWKANARPTKPMPFRCADFRALNEDFGEPVPEGKCDRFVALNKTSQFTFCYRPGMCNYKETRTWKRSYGQTWSAFLGTGATSLLNTQMFIPTASTAEFTYADTVVDPGGAKVISNIRPYRALSETYVALNQARYWECRATPEAPPQTCARGAAARGLGSWCGMINTVDTCNTPTSVMCAPCVAPLGSVTPAWDQIQAGGSMSLFINLAGGGAPPGGAVVWLYTADPTVTLPSSVTIPQGEPGTAVTLTVSDAAITVPFRLMISASYGGVTKLATITVLPREPGLAALGGPLTPWNAYPLAIPRTGGSVALSTYGSTTQPRTATVTSSSADVTPLGPVLGLASGQSTTDLRLAVNPAAAGTRATLAVSMNGSSLSRELIVVDSTISEIEPNDSPAASNTVSTNWTQVSGALKGQDHDYFTVFVPPGKTLKVERNGQVGYDAYGNLLQNMSLTDGAVTVAHPRSVSLTNSGAVPRLMTVHTWQGMDLDCNCYVADEPYTLLVHW